MAQRMTFRELSDLDVAGKAVFCRVDLNAPLEGDQVSDDTRIRAILPTVNYLLENGAKVTLASHLGRPKGKVNPKYSLLPVAQRLAELSGRDVTVPDDCVGSAVRKLLSEQREKEGQILLLENLRFHPGEEANDPNFAEQLKASFEVYVSDAFGALHRAHASTSALPHLFPERGVGLLVKKELDFLHPLLESPQRPYAVLLGGAKISDKVKTIETLLLRVDRLLLGGAMVFTFLKALGHKVGNSLVEDAMVERAKRMLENARDRNIEICFPKDFVLGQSLESVEEIKRVDGLTIPEGWMGLDIGEKTVEYYDQLLGECKTVFWNGPMGLFEKPPFDQGTMELARRLGQHQSVRVIGGGDSAAAVTKAGLAEKMNHISTGGGATLEYLEGKALPGLEALAV